MNADHEARSANVQSSRPQRAGAPPSRRSLQWRDGLLLRAAICVWFAPVAASAKGPPGASDTFQVCPRPGTSDTSAYALCATAQCFYLNGAAYCKCNRENGSSISLSFEYQSGNTTQNICDLLNSGVTNGYTVSTYSTPTQLKKIYADLYRPGSGDPPPLALYTCPGGSSGSYAQCDGGVCFSSSTSTTFPGVGPVAANQIICSCPVTEPRKTLPQREARVGYQITGPWQKQDGTACTGSDSASDCCSSGPQWPQGDWFSKFCFPSDSKPATGDIVPVGAPTGTARALSLMLDGPPSPQVNMCQVEQRGLPR
jgi:hypothetical protein